MTIRFRPFQLERPVDEPQPFVEALAARFGGHERAREIFAHTTGVASGAGLSLHSDRAVSANTFAAPDRGAGCQSRVGGRVRW